VRIGKEDKARELVKSVYLRLNHEHFELIIKRYTSQYHQIKHKTAYLKTMLYNVYSELEPFYINQVRADGVLYCVRDGK
jgi:hypothetical protein